MTFIFESRAATLRSIGPQRRARGVLALAWVTALASALACGEGAPARGPAIAPSPAPAATPRPSQEELAERYVVAKARVEAEEHLDAAKGAGVARELGEALRDVVQYGQDTHLRVNAALLLSSVASERKDPTTALAWTREAKALMPDEPLVRRAHALTLAGDGRFAEAIPEQEFVLRDDPDDLSAWLMLGELNVKAGRSEDAVLAYAAYEARRKGLLDGLTLKQRGQYVTAPADRARCALALVPASDGGTALGLLYALESEPEVEVRKAIVEAMALQRLGAYLQPLNKRKANETDAELTKLLDDAIAEIERDPVDVGHGPVPEGTLPAPEGSPPAVPAPIPADPGTEQAPAANAPTLDGSAAEREREVTGSDEARSPPPATPRGR